MSLERRDLINITQEREQGKENLTFGMLSEEWGIDKSMLINYSNWISSFFPGYFERFDNQKFREMLLPAIALSAAYRFGHRNPKITSLLSDGSLKLIEEIDKSVAGESEEYLPISRLPEATGARAPEIKELVLRLVGEETADILANSPVKKYPSYLSKLIPREAYLLFVKNFYSWKKYLGWEHFLPGSLVDKDEKIFGFSRAIRAKFDLAVEEIKAFLDETNGNKELNDYWQPSPNGFIEDAEYLLRDLESKLPGNFTGDSYQLQTSELLTPEEEEKSTWLFYKMKNTGTRLKEGAGSFEEESRNHFLEVKQRVRSLLVKTNLRLVLSIAKMYLYRGLTWDDLVQEGSFGLCMAVDKFDPRRGAKMSTHATWWIRQRIGRAVANQSRTIRLPIHLGGLLAKIYEIESTLFQQSGISPTNEELSQTLGMDRGRLEKILGARGPISLDAQVGPESGSTLLDFLTSPLLTDSEAIGRIERQKIEDVLETLTLQEANILKFRFGFKDGYCCTLEEIGRKYGLTRERIRQIEKVALSKLGSPSRREILEDLY